MDSRTWQIKTHWESHAAYCCLQLLLTILCVNFELTRNMDRSQDINDHDGYDHLLNTAKLEEIPEVLMSILTRDFVGANTVGTKGLMIVRCAAALFIEVMLYRLIRGSSPLCIKTYISRLLSDALAPPKPTADVSHTEPSPPTSIVQQKSSSSENSNDENKQTYECETTDDRTMFISIPSSINSLDVVKKRQKGYHYN